MATLTNNYQKLSEINMGSFGFGSWFLRLYGKYSNQNVANNQTTYQLQLRIYCAGYYCSSNNCYASIDGTTVMNNQYLSMGTNEEKIIGTKEITATHNTDGSKSETKSASFSCYALSGGTTTATFDLPKINRYPNFTTNPSIVSKTETSIVFKWGGIDMQSDIYYSLDNNTWIHVVADNTTITGLTANTNYTIYVQARNHFASSLATTKKISTKTYQYPYVNAVGASNLIIGKSQTLTLYNPLSRQVNVYMKQNGSPRELFIYEGSTSKTSITFTPEKGALYTSIPNSNSGSCFYYCSYIDSNKTEHVVSTKNGTYSIVENDCRPSIASSQVSYEEANTTVKNLTGSTSTTDPKIILGYSSLKISIKNAATTKYGSSVSKYIIKIGNETKTIITLGKNYPMSETFTNVKSNAVSIYVEDSRGVQSVALNKTNIVTINYTKPAISSSSNLKRFGGIGTDVILGIVGNYWGNNFGNSVNSITKLDYAKIVSTSNDWSSAAWTTLVSGTHYTATNGNIRNVNNATIPGFDLGVAYKVRIRATDKLDSSYIELTVTNGDVILAINKTKKSLGIGKIPDKGYALDVNGKVKATRFDGLASKAENDSDGNSIKNTYYKSLNLGKTSFKVIRGQSISTSTTGYWAAMCNSSQGGNPKLPSNNQWWHVISMDWQDNDTQNWISQLAIPTKHGGFPHFRHNNSSGNVDISNEKWHQLKESGVVLYNNASGSNGTITLSETVANFAYISIYYYRGGVTGGDRQHSITLYSPNGKYASLSDTSQDTSQGVMFMQSRNITISSTTITNTSGSYSSYGNWNSYSGHDKGTNQIYITRVEGYRN